MVYLIDTNIFLEVLLGQPKAAICEKFLNKFYDESQPMIVSLFSVHSIFINLINRKKFEKAESFIAKLTKSGNILLYRDDAEDHFEIIDVCNKTGLDFDDGMQYYIAKRAGCKAIISYDSDFDNLEVKRKIPEEFL